MRPIFNAMTSTISANVDVRCAVGKEVDVVLQGYALLY
jgi:hypothetical protein